MTAESVVASVASVVSVVSVCVQVHTLKASLHYLVIVRLSQII